MPRRSSTGRPLPSLAALGTLEAAIRTKSFLAAASELHVTPTAVSHQIKALEEALGVALFVRRNRRAEPTNAALNALSNLQAGFALLDKAVEQVTDKPVEETITICAEPALAAKWLVPKLRRLRSRDSRIRIRLQSSMGTIDTARFRGITPASFTNAGIDLSIRLGLGDYRGLVVERLLSLDVGPVLSPAGLLGQPPSDPRDLQAFILLHDRTRYRGARAWDWKQWFSSQGVEMETSPVVSLGSMALCVEAAIAGQGVALVPEALVQSELQFGRLIAPFEHVLPLDLAYYMVWPEEPRRPVLRDLRDWLHEEARQKRRGGPRR